MFGILCDKNERVLLSLRRDRPVWNLPGGHMDAGETVSEALIREFKEETGLRVDLDEIVGLYSHRTQAELTIIFRVFEIGGRLRKSAEAKKHKYFDFDEIPENTNQRHLGRIKDCLSKKDHLRISRQTEISISHLLKSLGKKI